MTLARQAWATARRFAYCLVLGVLLSGWPQQATALDPQLDLSQYGHRAWRNREGFAQTNTYVFAQTPDGYLWQGTGLGLTRFDGVQNKPWRPPSGASLPDIRVSALLVSRDGTLWIGTMGGLASWDGRHFSTYPTFRAHIISALAEDHDGAVWVAGAANEAGFLCAIRGASSRCFGNGLRLGPLLGPLHVGGDGSLWVGGFQGLWRWTQSRAPRFYALPDPEDANPGASFFPSGKTLSEDTGGAILTVTPQGLVEIENGEVRPYPAQSLLPSASLHRLFNDRDGTLWIGTIDAGLLHVHQGRVDRLGRAEGLSGNKVNKFFEDREGNVWVATRDGIDRFSALSAISYSSSQGLTGSNASVLAARDGSIWINTLTGLHRWRDGRMFVYRSRHAPSGSRTRSSPGPIAAEVIVSGLPAPGVASLFQDRRGRIWVGSSSHVGYLQNDRFTVVRGVPDGYVDAIAEDRSGALWIANRDAGLLRLSPDLEVRRVPAHGPLRTGHWWRLATDPVHGGAWIGSFSGGVVHVVNDRVREYYSVANGLGRGAVYDLRVSPDGSVWAATDGGVSRIRDGHITTIDSRNGLPCDQVNATTEESNGSTWLYTACGLVRVTRSDLNTWAVAAGQAGAPRAIRATVLDEYDGVRAFVNLFSTATPKLSQAPDGRLWFATLDGFAVVDPRHLHINTLPPPVHVEEIIADRKTYDVSSPIRLPPLVRDLQIDYTALSLTAPERIRFRYKLEGRDREWQDAGNRRQAFYNDLAPGNYRFRVIASNNSGVWNEQGATLAFSIAPAYWQTYWFMAFCLAAIGLLVWAIFQIRRHQRIQAQEIEKRHRDLQLELAHANRLATIGQLTASITHEIRQPITSVLSSGYAARRWLSKPDAEEANQAIERIIREATRADNVISGLRTLVKKGLAQNDSFEINEAIREVVVITRSEAVKHKVSVATRLDEDLPPVSGDRVQFQQVLLNLIANAIEAMSIFEGPRELLIETEQAGDFASIAVHDTGPGLSTENLVSAFEAFYTTKPDGLGMGLSVCRSIVEAHGGKLEVAANAPRGAVFRFTIPIAKGAP